jgi:hypothetical protein
MKVELQQQIQLLMSMLPHSKKQEKRQLMKQHQLNEIQQ